MNHHIAAESWLQQRFRKIDLCQVSVDSLTHSAD